MTLTVDLLRTWFKQYNADYFADELPLPRFVLNKARTRLGSMGCKRVRRIFGWAYSDFTISISTYYDCTEREYQTTLLHEMIHYYITYKRIPDTSSHGRVFREMMARLNNEYGWHITISSSMRGRQLTDASSTAKTSYLVLAIVLDDGKRMLSVVNPRSARTIDAQAGGVKRIVDHRWYMTQDAYFRDFPRVRTLRARLVATDVYNEKTAAMQPLVLK